MNRRQDTTTDSRSVRALEDSPLARFLFGDVRLAWLWLILRLYAGWQWLEAGWGKWHNPAWTGDKAGTAISGFVQGALAKSSGANPAVQSWYAWFLQHVVLAYPVAWSYLVLIGETLVGVALILGLFTGIAAFFGSFMNMNYLLAGTVSTNPVLFVIATWLVLAWKTAGCMALVGQACMQAPQRTHFFKNSFSATAPGGRTKPWALAFLVTPIWVKAAKARPQPAAPRILRRPASKAGLFPARGSCKRTSMAANGQSFRQLRQSTHSDLR